jgi:HEAT repeat protein/beta-lactamase regulating signal transducer with metallopeptidase domain
MTATQLLGWTLLHFLWQGAIVATVLAILLQLTRRLAPVVRYRLSLGALGLMVLCPLVTADRLASLSPVERPHPLSPSPFGSGGTASQILPSEQGLPPEEIAAPDPIVAGGEGNPDILATVRRRLEPWLPWLVGLWVTGVLLLSVRLLGGLVRTRRVARAGGSPDPAHAAVFAELVRRMGIDAPVRLLESAALAVPAVIGWLRPVVLLPAAAAAGLTPQQLELLLAHELAHVRRHDFLVNLLQSVVEILLFYHPAAWWVSARVREERELCCDDAALAACGHPREYAGALLALASWRLPLPVPAAVGSGSLLRRVRRILGQDAAAVELGPVWMAGLFAAALAIAVVIGVPARAEAPAAPEPDAARPSEDPGFVAPADTGPVRPDTVVRYDGTEPLPRRWDWALGVARQQGFEAYWVGYVVPVPESDGLWQYLDRHVPVQSEDSRLSGHIQFRGPWNDLRFDGTPLSPILGEREPRDLAVLLGYVADSRGARLVRVHLSNWVFPVHFGGWPLMWLGQTNDAESVARLRALYAEAPSSRLKEDLIEMVSAHPDPAAAVPALVDWLESREPDELRAEAAEGLGGYAVPEALEALDRSARGDRARSVRAESVETMGELGLPEARAALEALIQNEPDVDLQRAAVEALGRLPDAAGLQDLLEIARRHRSAEVRAEAVETLGDLERPDAVLEPLIAIAREDPHPDVQREAVETLSGLKHEAAFAALLTLAREHPREEIQVSAVEALNDAADDATAVRALVDLAEKHTRAEVRRAAVEALGSVEAPEAAFGPLERMIWRLPDVQTQVEAVETVGELELPTVVPLLTDVAQRHPREEVRLEAVGSLGDSHDHAAAIESLRKLAEDHPSQELRVEAVDHLGDFEDPEVTALLWRLVREHRDVEVRRQAVEEVVEREVGSAELEALAALAKNDPDPDLRDAALEALGELHDGAGVPALIEIARSHPDRRIRVRAIELLGETDDPRALEALRNLIRP